MFKTNVKITYAESWLPIHHKFFIHTVELLSARIALEKRYKNFISNSKNKTGTELWKHALTSMGIKTPDLAPVPKRGKGKGLIIAANHPFGVTDGVFLSWFASTFDDNFRVIAHGVLQKEPTLADNILPIDFSNKKNAMRDNVITRQTAIQILKNGGVIAIFPAGGVAWARKKGLPVEEDDWKPMLGRLINDSKCDVLITKFGGQNSRAFQFASRLHQTFKQSLYLYEIRKSLDKPIEFKVLKYDKKDNVNVQEKMKMGALTTRQVLFDPFTCYYEVINPKTDETEGSLKTAGRDGLPLSTTLRNPEFDKTGKNEDYTRTTYRLLDKGTLPTGDTKQQIDKSAEENFKGSDIENQAILRYNQFFSSQADIVIPGNFALHAGDMIHLDVPGLSDNRTETPDDQDGGLYIITDICHTITAKSTFTRCNLSRDSIGRKPAP